MTEPREHGPAINNRLLAVGGVLTVVGAAVSTLGSVLAAAAMLSALRQWAQSEQRRELMLKARAASNAAAASWRQQAPSRVTLPDATAPAPSRVNG